jgi:hypothetical protein
MPNDSRPTMHQFIDSDYSSTSYNPFKNEHDTLVNENKENKKRIKYLNYQMHNVYNTESGNPDWFSQKLQVELNSKMNKEEQKLKGKIDKLKLLFDQKVELEKTQTDLMNRQNEILNNLTEKKTKLGTKLKSYTDNISTGMRNMYHTNSDIRLLEKIIAVLKFMFFLFLIVVLSLFVANRVASSTT